MEQGNRKAEPHYYSDKLKQKLAKIRFASTTVVEAPSGYGKTTILPVALWCFGSYSR